MAVFYSPRVNGLKALSDGARSYDTDIVLIMPQRSPVSVQYSVQVQETRMHRVLFHSLLLKHNHDLQKATRCFGRELEDGPSGEMY